MKKWICFLAAFTLMGCASAKRVEVEKVCSNTPPHAVIEVRADWLPIAEQKKWRRGKGVWMERTPARR